LPILRNTAVLHIGDSFAVAGFVQALRPRMKALGVRYEVHAETSSFTTTWAARLPRLIADSQPDLVIINLGANEMSNVDPAAHAPAIKRIVKAIAPRPCVWVSPPSWGPDTGITDVIRESSAPCRFFDSDRLVKGPIPRQKDGIHPSAEGGALWADAFWTWLLHEHDASGVGPDGSTQPWLLRPGPAGEHTPLVPYVTHTAL
jgi:lysophospholipase L1-like esterase